MVVLAGRASSAVAGAAAAAAPGPLEGVGSEPPALELYPAAPAVVSSTGPCTYKAALADECGTYWQSWQHALMLYHDSQQLRCATRLTLVFRLELLLTHSLKETLDHHA